MSKLRECPFCGNKNVEVVHRQNSEWWYAYCNGCSTDGSPDLGESGAIERWNARPMEDALRARVAELEARDDSGKRYARGTRGLRIRAAGDAGIILREHITDGFGSYWLRDCPNCGAPMMILKPGFARCSAECYIKDGEE